MVAAEWNAVTAGVAVAAAVQIVAIITMSDTVDRATLALHVYVTAQVVVTPIMGVAFITIVVDVVVAARRGVVRRHVRYGLCVGITISRG